MPYHYWKYQQSLLPHRRVHQGHLLRQHHVPEQAVVRRQRRLGPRQQRRENLRRQHQQRGALLFRKRLSEMKTFRRKHSQAIRQLQETQMKQQMFQKRLEGMKKLRQREIETSRKLEQARMKRQEQHMMMWQKVKEDKDSVTSDYKDMRMHHLERTFQEQMQLQKIAQIKDKQVYLERLKRQDSQKCPDGRICQITLMRRDACRRYEDSCFPCSFEHCNYTTDYDVLDCEVPSCSSPPTPPSPSPTPTPPPRPLPTPLPDESSPWILPGIVVGFLALGIGVWLSRPHWQRVRNFCRRDQQVANEHNPLLHDEQPGNDGPLHVAPPDNGLDWRGRIRSWRQRINVDMPPVLSATSSSVESSEVNVSTNPTGTLRKIMPDRSFLQRSPGDG